MSRVLSLCVLALVLSPLLVHAQTADACTPTRQVRCPTPIEIVSSANDAARQRPSFEAFSAARQIYPYEPGALYELYASPTHISVILLEPGEIITGIAAGDTSRWMVTEVEVEAQQDPRTIVLVKPQSVGLATNIVIATDRRTYLVEARAISEARYSAEIAWTYPSLDRLVAPQASAPLNFEYRIRTVRGALPRWLPARVFDDGRRTWIEFPPEVEAADMPPVFVITPEGAELANTRVDGRRLMIDRLIDRAELRLGARAPIIVRIERGDAPPRARPRRMGGRR